MTTEWRKWHERITTLSDSKIRTFQPPRAGQRDGEDSNQARASGNGEEIRRHPSCDKRPKPFNHRLVRVPKSPNEFPLIRFFVERNVLDEVH